MLQQHITLIIILHDFDNKYQVTKNQMFVLIKNIIQAHGTGNNETICFTLKKKHW